MKKQEAIELSLSMERATGWRASPFLPSGFLRAWVPQATGPYGLTMTCTRSGKATITGEMLPAPVRGDNPVEAFHAFRRGLLDEVDRLNELLDAVGRPGPPPVLSLVELRRRGL